MCWINVFFNLKERDAGGYECQIPSATPRSYKVNLNIVGEEAMLASVSHELEAIVSVFVRRECVLCPWKSFCRLWWRPWGFPPLACNKDIPQKAIPFVLFVIILSEGFNIVFLFGEFVMHTGTYIFLLGFLGRDARHVLRQRKKSRLQKLGPKPSYSVSFPLAFPNIQTKKTQTHHFPALAFWKITRCVQAEKWQIACSCCSTPFCDAVYSSFYFSQLKFVYFTFCRGRGKGKSCRNIFWRRPAEIRAHIPFLTVLGFPFSPFYDCITPFLPPSPPGGLFLKRP